MDYKIQINGLAQGKHEFSFPISKKLFEDFDNTQIIEAELVAKILLEKGIGWMSVGCNVMGDIFVECDRCLDMLRIPINFKADLAIRQLRVEEKEEDDDCIIVDPSDGEVDLKQFLYDYICVNIPIKHVHEEGKCNQQMLEKLNLSSKVAEQVENNSPFSNIKELINRKK